MIFTCVFAEVWVKLQSVTNFMNLSLQKVKEKFNCEIKRQQLSRYFDLIRELYGLNLKEQSASVLA